MEAQPRTIALVVEYDGSFTHGMQRQSELPTVAGAIDSALSVLLGESVHVVNAGRTDAGVHATGQVVSFATTAPVELRRLPVALSAMLRSAHVAVVRAVERPADFSARRSAVARTYRYRILNRPAPSPLHVQRAFHIGAHLDFDAMRSAAGSLAGEHDFAAFCATPPKRGGTTRKVTSLKVEREADFIDVSITADSFLHHMVRIIVGTLVQVGRGQRGPGDVARLLAPATREDAGFTAPPHALYLERVHYADPF
ncbi:MAG TPA: tRNA pseudouridine(38-40) synthase TruA [Candidatus Eremiobacteraceae bacterium]|nr:tRNA pseudouridine(38-40) synthase TruA [Candidatus Eremiobacteraceae bacterium]